MSAPLTELVSTEALGLLHSLRADVRELRTLRLRTHGGPDTHAAIGEGWQRLPGRPESVRILAVADPAGSAGLWGMCCRISANTLFAGGSTDQSQLITVLSGSISCNGRAYRHGDTLWLAAHQPAQWQVGPEDYDCFIRFAVPAPC